MIFCRENVRDGRKLFCCETHNRAPEPGLVLNVGRRRIPEKTENLFSPHPHSLPHTKSWSNRPKTLGRSRLQVLTMQSMYTGILGQYRITRLILKGFIGKGVCRVLLVSASMGIMEHCMKLPVSKPIITTK